MENKLSLKSVFTNGIFKENPVLNLMLGLCSTLAITTNLTNAIGMGISVIFVLTFSNLIVSLIRNITPNQIRIPVYIVVIATLVKVVEMVLHAYAPTLYTSLGTFLGLIVVNCIILGRAEGFASKNSPLSSAVDGLGMGIGYTLVILLISATRQFLSTGGLSLVNPLTNQSLFEFTLIPKDFTIATFGTPVGAFITFGCIFAISVAFKNAAEAKAKLAAKQAKVSESKGA